MLAFILAFVSGVLAALKRLFGIGPAPVPPVVTPPSPAPTDRFPLCLPFTLKEEGGFVDNPSDPGGATFQGITLAAYRTFLMNPAATVEELKAIKPEEVAAIYRRDYWQLADCVKLPPGVDLSVFDMAVNAGPARSVMILQGAVGAMPDGLLGPKTLAAVAKFAPSELLHKLYLEQLAFYKSLKDFALFGKGWTARCTARLTTALAMLPTA